MAIVVTDQKLSSEELKKTQEAYLDYVKVVVDIENKLLAAGGEWHADAERELLRHGSQQTNLWGGGVDLESGLIDFISLINARPGISTSQEVLDMEVRKKMTVIIKRTFDL